MNVKLVVDSLIDAGIHKKQAQAISKAISDSMELSAQSNRNDHFDFITKLELKSGLKGLENTLIKWMIGTAMGILVIVFSVTFVMIQVNTDTLNQRIGDVNQRVGDIGQRMDNIEQRMNTLEKGINENKVLIQKVLANTSK